VFYYITLMNENYRHPPKPKGVDEGILKGMYLFKDGGSYALKVQLLGSGAILNEVIAAGELLKQDFGVTADVWSVPSFTELRREGLQVSRWNMLHPEAEPRVSYVERCLKDRKGPLVAATDYMKTYADQIRAFIPNKPYRVLGTDGYGRSDTRAKLRWFFEVDRHFVAVAALKALVDEGSLPPAKVAEAIKKYGIDPDKPDPVTV
jgi:pyruvate dehydrogenase E1 component